MEYVVQGRNVEVSERFRTHVKEKLAKVEQFAPKAQRVNVEIIHENNPSQAEVSERVEIAVHDKGPAIRAEAAAGDRYSALDLATQKLIEQLRRAHERHTHHRKTNAKRDLKVVELDFAALLSAAAEQEEVVKEIDVPKVGEIVETQLGDSPVVIRQKTHEAKPMSVDQALYEMELVGHPFYLFIDAQTMQPCVAYRRRGWTYGIIRLDVNAED